MKKSNKGEELRQHRITQRFRRALINHWCKAFGVESCKKSVITMMLNRTTWILPNEMTELIDICAQKMKGESEERQAKYMAGILRRKFSDMGIDYEKEKEFYLKLSKGLIDAY